MDIIQDRSADSIIAALGGNSSGLPMGSPRYRVTILPIAIYTYVDKVMVWIKRPWTQIETAWIAGAMRRESQDKPQRRIDLDLGQKRP